MLAQGLRFVGVGGLATLVHVIVALSVQAGLGIGDLAANLAGWSAAVTLSYFGHLHMTFGVAPAHSTQAPRFVLTSVIGLVVSSALVTLVTGLGGSFVAAMAVVSVGVPAMTFVLLHFWVFDDQVAKARLSLPDLMIPLATGLGMLVIYWGQTLHHDVVWYHVATRKWLDGAALYTDIVEVNPPLNFYLTLPVIWLADLTGLSDMNAQFVFLAGLTTISLWLVARELQAATDISVKERLALLAGMGMVLTILPLGDAGQREHLFILFTLPWLTSRLAPTIGQPGREGTLAFLAAVGMCLKPFFVVLPAVILIHHALRQRRLSALFSVSGMTFLATGLLYIAAVFILHPTYLTDTLPMARLVYGAYGGDVALVLGRVSTTLWILVIAGVWTVSRPEPATGAFTFFLAALSGVIIYLWQGTGFGYHTLPFVIFGALGCVVACRDPRCRTIALVALMTVSFVALNRGYYHNWAVKRIVPVVEAKGPVDRLLVVTTHVSAGPIVAQHIGAEWVSNYPTQWLVPGAFGALAQTDCTANADRCRAIQSIADRNRDDLIATMVDTQPDMIVFSNTPGYFHVPKFDWHAWLGTHSAYSGIMDRYAQVAEDIHFTYWTRQPSMAD